MEILNFEISESTFHYIVLPLMIFFARILDVSINTLRIIFVMSGRKWVSTFLGFFESLIWLLAIGQIFRHIDNVFSYVAYPMGFATGILVGMMIEEKLALGKVVVRIIDDQPLAPMQRYLDANKIRYTIIRGESSEGPKNILFSVIKRDSLPLFLAETKKVLPKSYYTVESVKQANETGLLPEESRKPNTGSWLSTIKRK